MKSLISWYAKLSVARKAAVVFSSLVIISIVIALFASTSSVRLVDSFQACKDVGGSIQESYPERCVFNGKTYTNTTQSVTDSYIGLIERAALGRAKNENKAARVVERDGKPMVVTTDYSPGRLNFSVENGKVVEVSVEGEDR